MSPGEWREASRELPVKAWALVAAALVLAGVVTFVQTASVPQALLAAAGTLLVSLTLTYRQMYVRHRDERASEAETHTRELVDVEERHRREAEAKDAAIASAQERQEMLRAELAAAEAKLADRWVNDGTIPAPRREFVGTTPDGRYRWVFEVTSNSDLWPVRLRLLLSEAVCTARAEQRSVVRDGDVLVAVQLLDGNTVLELRSNETLHSHGDLVVIIEAEPPADVDVLDVKRYREA